MEKDLDLDELHQAVNALMDEASKGKKKPNTAAPVRPVVPSESPQPALAEPKPDVPKDAEPDNDNGVRVAVNPPKPQLAVRRSPHGRAMDVIGPKTSPKAAPPSARATRTAPALQPTQRVTPEPPSPSPVENPKQALGTKEPTPQKSIQNEWPDPLDVHGFKEQSPKEQSESNKPEESMAPDLNLAESKEPQGPFTGLQPEEKSDEPSPRFISTKVQKRPLGAYATTTPPEKPVEPIVPEDKKEEAGAAPQTAGPQPPKELSPEVMAVESSEPEFHPHQPEVPEKAGADMHELRQMAIPQQYQTKEKSVKEDQRPVFDTQDYHPPLVPAHVPPRRSGWGWVLILVFIIVLLGVLAGMYYLMTGTLDFTALL